MIVLTAIRQANGNGMGTMRNKTLVMVSVALGLITASVLPAAAAHAQSSRDFNLQITPSPLVLTAKPGESKTVAMTIRNLGSGPETLRMDLRSFSFDNATGKVSLNEKQTPEIASWISFSNQYPVVQPGQVITDNVTIKLPPTAGFSYSFALLISRKNPPKTTAGTRVIRGQVAVFGLMNVDRPGATRKLEVAKFSSTKSLFEYLPAQLTVRFKNTGNTIVQPYGNVFIQRKSDSKTPISVLPVNATSSYILPNTERATSVAWNDGFPNYETVHAGESNESQSLNWDFGRVNKLRIGKYTAKLVAVYNDGQHDIPIEGEVSFWVFPWRAVLFLLLIIAGLIFFVRWRSKKRTEKAVNKALAKAKKSNEKE